jgi:hypothetical protein
MELSIMPLYVYQNPVTDEYIEVLQGMNDEHVYIDSEGLEWRRIFFVPNANFDTEVDPYNKSDFMKATENKKGTIGEMMEYSRELSEKRAEKDGKDPVKEKYYKEYEKKNHMKHPARAKVYESKNVRVEYD